MYIHMYTVYIYIYTPICMCTYVYIHIYVYTQRTYVCRASPTSIVVIFDRRAAAAGQIFHPNLPRSSGPGGHRRLIEMIQGWAKQNAQKQGEFFRVFYGLFRLDV